MKLDAYINSFPESDRVKIRIAIAEAHGVSEITVRAWANGNRRHPYTLEAVQITEAITAGNVTRYDVRPEVFQPPEQAGTG